MIRMITSIFITGVVLFMALPLKAQGNGLGFPKNSKYDITYDAGGDSAITVRNVEILDIVKINTEEFLSFQAADFKLSNKEGYILFKSVRAIIPNSVYIIDGNVKYSQ